MAMDLEEKDQLCEDCMRKQSKLTDWECEFIDSVYSQEYPLTNKQEITLQRIWERVT